MIITGFGFVAQIFQSGKTDGNCIAQIGFYAWYIIYPLVFFKTIQDDSDYHWVYASKPLIESTAKSIADLDLFSLPGYHGVHFESTEDKKFRFKKLKQMVSGYVPIIPFTKIKFENNDEDTRSTISSNSSPSRSSKSSKNNGHAPNAPNGGGASKRDNQTIGAGSTSKVYRGMYKQQPVAVKCLSRLDKKTDMSWTDLTLIFRESILSSSLSHPNVVKFLGASLTYNGFFLVYEYCAYGDLQQILVEHSHPEEPKLSSIPQRLFYLLDIAEGMKFLHKSGFVHRDLKTANVVVNYSKKNKRFVGKICDFGVSRQLPQEQEERMSRNAMAHDRFNKSLSTTYSDVGSFADDNSTVLSVGNGSNLTVNSNGVQSVNTVGSGYGIQTFTPSQAGVGATTLLHGNNHNLNANALSEKHKQWQKFATRGNTKEITRTIHVGTPAFLAPEILLKLVKSKGVDLEKERKKQKKRERKKMQEKLKRRKERERKRKEKESKENKGDIESTSIQKAVGRTLNDIDEEKENVNNAEENLSDDDDDGITSAPHHYVRGAILDHNIDPHIYCDFSTDVYSFGMILWSIVTSKLPYKGFKPMDMILMIKNAQRLSVSDKEWKKWGTCREIDIDVEKLQDLLEQCWAQYPYQRPSFEQIGEILTNIITDSHRKHSDLPKMVIDPESLMTNNTSINNSNIIDRHRHDTT